MKTSRKHLAAALTVAVSISMTPIFAQISGTSGKLLLVMGANAKRMTQYEWKQRVIVVRKGSPQNR